MNPGFREGAWLPGLSPRSWPDTDQQVVCILLVCIWPESPQEVVESPWTLDHLWVESPQEVCRSLVPCELSGGQSKAKTLAFQSMIADECLPF